MARVTVPRSRAILVALVMLLVPLAGCVGTGGTVNVTNGTVDLRNDTLVPPTDETPTNVTDRPMEPPNVEELCQPTVDDPDADPDRDGLTNQEEAWWATDPAKADTDADGVSDGAEVERKTPPAPPRPALDFDGDALPDGAEACIIGTDPTLLSTDGDFYGDGQEYYGTQFVTYVHSPGGDTYTRAGTVRDMPAAVPKNPFQPAVADLLVEVTNPVFVLEETYVEGNEEKTRRAEEVKGTGYLNFDAKAWAQISYTHTATSKAGYPPWEKELSSENELKWEVGARAELSGGVGFGWEKSRLKDNTEFTVTQKDFSASELQANLRFTNVGNDVLRDELKEVLVNFYLGGDLVNTWRYSADKPAKIENVAPGKFFEYGPLQVKLTYQQYLDMRNGRSLTAHVAHFSFGRDQLDLDNVRERTVKVTVDGPDGVHVHHVAVGDDPTPLENVYAWIGEMEVEDVGGRKRIKSVDGREIVHNETPPFTYWTFKTMHRDGPDDQTSEVYSDLLLKGGDQVLISWQHDTDGDLLVDDLEEAYGTEVDGMDTDGDGLWDGEEVLGIRRGQADVDEDDMFPPDANFTDTHRSNPFLKDSDGDTILDPDDPEPMVILADTQEVLAHSWEWTYIKTMFGKFPAGSTAHCRLTPATSDAPGDWWPECNKFLTGNLDADHVDAGDVDGDGLHDLVNLTLARKHRCDERQYGGSTNDNYRNTYWRNCWDVTCSVLSGATGTRLVDGAPCGRVYASAESVHKERQFITSWETLEWRSEEYKEHNETNEDVLAVGSIDERAGADIIIAEPRTGTCTTFYYSIDRNALVKADTFKCGFGYGHHVATGEFELGRIDRDELLVTRGHEQCAVYDADDGKELKAFKCGYKAGSRIAVGNVDGDAHDEVVTVATAGEPRCIVANLAGHVEDAHCGDAPARRGGIAIGQVVPGGWEELLIVEQGKGKQCRVWEFRGNLVPYAQDDTLWCWETWGHTDLVSLFVGNFKRPDAYPK